MLNKTLTLMKYQVWLINLNYIYLVEVVKEHVFLRKSQTKDAPVSHHDAPHVNINKPILGRYIFILHMYL